MESTHGQAYHMITECFLIFHVFKAVFTNPQLSLFAIVIREWREIPGINFIFSYLNFINKLDLGDLKIKEEIK